MNAVLGDVRLADLLYLGRRRNASDIHLVPGVRPAIRVDGELEFIEGSPTCADETALLVEHLFDQRSLERLNRTGDVTGTYRDGDDLVCRVHARRSSGDVAIAIRRLHHGVPTLASLDLPPVVRSLASKQRGLILFAGPTGSGKSTSLAAFVDEINQTAARHIITIEDPAEYLHEPARSLISRREVGRDVSSFSSAVIGALRSDPDVIVIGEMRDVATMRAALTAAETGHLVLSTLHTGDAVQTVNRIVDAFDGNDRSEARTQLASTLVAVVSQRLVRKPDRCGRRVAAEVLVATDAVRSTIRDARTHQLRNLMLTGRRYGMQTLEYHLEELVRDQQIAAEVAAAMLDRCDGSLDGRDD